MSEMTINYYAHVTLRVSTPSQRESELGNGLDAGSIPVVGSTPFYGMIVEWEKKKSECVYSAGRTTPQEKRPINIVATTVQKSTGEKTH